jgi:RNA polymerase sigma-70 factor, ECF subfamily
MGNDDHRDRSRRRYPLTMGSRAAREGSERAVRAAMRAGAIGDAAQEALRLYGDEVYGFLLGVMDSSGAARDVYARVGERVARALGGFAWRCSLRAFLYAIARQEIGRDDEGAAATGADPASCSVVLPDPTTTVPRRRVAVKAAIAALRSRLPREDRAVLILRIDRRFGWRDLAITSLGEGASPSDLSQESHRLRERLQHIREELARAAVEAHLLSPQ